MNDSILIKKRDGTIQPFDIIKIKRAIGWACRGVDVNPLELESHFHINVRDKMSTSQIQHVLINTALNMTNSENNLKNLNWRIVAARLLLLDLYNKSKRTRNYSGFGYGPYLDFIKQAINDGIYDGKILEIYSEEDIIEMEKERNLEYDKEYDYAGMNLLCRRYLLKLKKRVFELPQDMYLTISLLLASNEKKEDRLRIAKKTYHLIASKKISLATPIVLNLRRVKGNLASCFISAVDDSLEGIYYNFDQISQISKNAGGSGINLSRVRSHGAYIKGYKGASGGVMPWIKIINDTAVAVDQLGSRAGAITVALDIWHKDIEDFLEMQSENGDQRKKSFDIFPQIVVSDLFMKRVEENGKWTLFDPHEIMSKFNKSLPELYGLEFEEFYKRIEEDDSLELKKKVSARDLFKKVLRTVVETGLPYVFFKDSVNNVNPNKHCGMIGNANLCVESFSNFSPSVPLNQKLEGNTIVKEIEAGEVHTCNLISLNLATIEESELKEILEVAVRILDNTIEIGTTPLLESKIHNEKYRVIGIGMMGLADYLAKNFLAYDKSKVEVSRLFEKIAYYGVLASSNLAKERGVYPVYRGSEWNKGIFFGKDINWFKENSTMSELWVSLIDRVKENGMRNGGLFAIAPNTSTSMLSGVSASVLPIYKKFFVDKAAQGAVPICPPFLSSETFWYYVENQNIDQRKIIEIISEIQKWIDQGISMELILNLQKGIKAKDIYDYYMLAWKLKCKTVYYVRSITLSSESDKKECISCAN
jgi:ribonucleoside-diphosphate reductase alpha chain